MSISLDRFTSGMTAYIAKHNANCSAIESAVNVLQADVAALKGAVGAGADLDLRLASFNFLINGAFDYWQRGNSTRPDAWKIRNNAVDFAVARESTTTKLNTYSAKTTNQGQLTQDFPDELRLAFDSTMTFSFGVYVKTDTADQARIGVYDGTTTSYSTYHSGGDTWEWIAVNVTFSSTPSAIRFVLDSAGGTVYWNSVVVIRGNPSAGPTFVSNDPILERIRVMSLYETGSTNVRGVGFLNGSDRELEQRIEFAGPKRATPVVTIEDDDTGYDFTAYNVDRHGFNLLVAEVGGASGTDGFEYEDITWTAEVSGT